MKKLGKKKQKKMSDDLLSAAILARRRQAMASGIALDPLHRLMRLVMYRRTDRASETADKYGTFLSFFLAFEPAVRTGQYGPKTCPMAASSGFPEAMDPLYQLVLGGVVPVHEFERRNRSDGGAFVCRQRIPDQPKRNLLT
jgi:hypothetical protein